MNRTYDAEFCEHLTQSGLEWTAMHEHSRSSAENSWREIYERRWPKLLRMRRGSKAEFAYLQEHCTHYIIVPFTLDVDGLPISVHHPRRMLGYECRGPMPPLGLFHNIEFFISPLDLSWTMIHTHEDHGFGGPYFIRREWIP